MSARNSVVVRTVLVFGWNCCSDKLLISGSAAHFSLCQFSCSDTVDGNF